MKTKLDDFNIKEFVKSLYKLGVRADSKEIAAFLTRKGHHVSPGTIASIKAHITRAKKPHQHHGC